MQGCAKNTEAERCTYNEKTGAPVEDYTLGQGARMMLAGLLICLGYGLDGLCDVMMWALVGVVRFMHAAWDWRKLIVMCMLAVACGVALPWLIIAISWLIVG